MSHQEFLALPPIVFTMMGREVRLVPSLDHQGAAYKSPPMDLLVDGPNGMFRVTGQFILRCQHSRHWPEKP